jgi:tudor domain-containing protein 1/4/6/7
MERIHSLILDPKFVNQKDISATIGKPCLAFYPVDGKWHRAIVKALNGNMITVCYVDYGISYTLRTSYLRELHQDLITLPALAFKCCLDGSEFISKIVADTLKDRFLKSSAFAAQFCKVVDGVLHIRLRHVQTMGPNLLN